MQGAFCSQKEQKAELSAAFPWAGPPRKWVVNEKSLYFGRQTWSPGQDQSSGELFFVILICFSRFWFLQYSYCCVCVFVCPLVMWGNLPLATEMDLLLWECWSYTRPKDTKGENAVFQKASCSSSLFPIDFRLLPFVHFLLSLMMHYSVMEHNPFPQTLGKSRAGFMLKSRSWAHENALKLHQESSGWTLGKVLHWAGGCSLI